MLTVKEAVEDAAAKWAKFRELASSYLLSWIRTHVELGGWMGWDVDEKGIPWFVMLEHVRGPSEAESSVICKKWDDESVGLFGMRDWTSSGIPLCRDGELYWSGWWFQFREDAERFQKMYGGCGTWQDEYADWERRCQERRAA